MLHRVSSCLEVKRLDDKQHLNVLTRGKLLLRSVYFIFFSIRSFQTTTCGENVCECVCECVCGQSKSRERLTSQSSTLTVIHMISLNEANPESVCRGPYADVGLSCFTVLLNNCLILCLGRFRMRRPPINVSTSHDL